MARCKLCWWGDTPAGSGVGTPPQQPQCEPMETQTCKARCGQNSWGILPSLYQAHCKSQTPQLQEQHSAVKLLLEVLQDTSQKVTSRQWVPQIQVEGRYLTKITRPYTWFQLRFGDRLPFTTIHIYFPTDPVSVKKICGGASILLVGWPDALGRLRVNSPTREGRVAFWPRFREQGRMKGRPMPFDQAVSFLNLLIHLACWPVTTINNTVSKQNVVCNSSLANKHRTYQWNSTLISHSNTP